MPMAVQLAIAVVMGVIVRAEQIANARRAMVEPDDLVQLFDTCRKVVAVIHCAVKMIAIGECPHAIKPDLFPPIANRIAA